MTGKEKCAHLRRLREEIARENNIPYESTPCDYRGDDCTGTCPKCEQELEYLTKALQLKEKMGAPVSPEAAWELAAAHAQPRSEPDPMVILGNLEMDIPEDEVGLIEYAEPEIPMAPEHPPVCPACGSIQNAGNKFCDKCGFILTSKTSGGWGSPGWNDGNRMMRTPLEAQADMFVLRVEELVRDKNPEHIRQLQLGMEEILRWVRSMETREDRERRKWEMRHMQTPGVMISDEELKKRKKRKGWFK